MRGISVLVAGAGLSGLTAAYHLAGRGAAVTVIDARDRIGGRVLTVREPFLYGQHAEAGADLIDESQSEICALIRKTGLRTARILRDGFATVRQNGNRRRIAGRRSWIDLQKRLQSEIRAFCLSEQRWDSGVAASLASESVAHWLDRSRAPRPVRDAATGMRGFFLADPEELSLIALADQFAEDGMPGSEKMFRIVGGNDRLPHVLADAFPREVRLQTVLRRTWQSSDGIVAAVESHGTIAELRADYLVCTLPATTLRDVPFDPPLPEPQRQAIATVKYGDATKTALQFDRAIWRARGKPRAFGTPFSVGAAWDGNEQQTVRRQQVAAAPGILSLLAGGSASSATSDILDRLGPAGIVNELTWLDLRRSTLVGWSSTTWERERWSRGGYAYFDPSFPPHLRLTLAHPFGRVVFAGEHTSMRWQGYMNGAVETGLRAAEEIQRQINSGSRH